jgi:hypothetical protein
MYGEKMLVQTRSGEKLIGEIVEPTDKFYAEKLGVSKMGPFGKDSFDGIWFKRKSHMSFIGHTDILP